MWLCLLGLSWVMGGSEWCDPNHTNIRKVIISENILANTHLTLREFLEKNLIYFVITAKPLHRHQICWRECESFDADYSASVRK